ncbi:hypothetical protein [Brenneria salicis]|uniref:Uncharacterized protein n=1 Tax=Brenneria salicis ATCC 15712 = DSM 30166 TaxID=714314 RepID=A0A366ICY1_9GAMM|nr:hypothetical protein [Brenneria salicis]RBP66944.1 hypothetical protein DES54_102157 [Brenneria salicis ATCC 15712 = DSM 30166]RLM32089.1 hypothetical protein BHG07_01520 [Brenneria salicis ATCC 15712 = DSM 30166]
MTHYSSTSVRLSTAQVDAVVVVRVVVGGRRRQRAVTGSESSKDSQTPPAQAERGFLFAPSPL